MAVLSTLKTSLKHPPRGATIVGRVYDDTNADLEYNPADYPVLLAPFAQGADVVSGSRFRQRSDSD